MIYFYLWPKHSVAEGGGTFPKVLSPSKNDNVVFVNGKPVLVAQPLTVVRALSSTGGARVLAAPLNPDEFDASKTPLIKVKEEPYEEEKAKTVINVAQPGRSMLSFDDFLKATNTKVASEEEWLKSMEVEPPVQAMEGAVDADRVCAENETVGDELVEESPIQAMEEVFAEKEAVEVEPIEEPPVQAMEEVVDVDKVCAEEEAVEVQPVEEPPVQAIVEVVDVDKVCAKKEAARDEVKVVNKEAVEEKIPNLEDGEFPKERGWSLLGRKVEVAISTAKGVKRLVDNEIIHFNFPLQYSNYKFQWIVRISTKRSGEVGRMPMEWAKTVIPPASFLVSLQYMQRILADAMGLGKTVMTIALILSNSGRERSENSDWESIYDSIITNKRKHVNSSCKVEGSTLIVCPMALLGQWKDELETHSKPGSISIFVHYGGSRTNSAELISGYDVVLTTYGVLSAAYKSDGENSIYHRVQWHRVVLDEAHTIKAQRSQVAQSAFALSSHCRWCLTGTPLQFIKRKNSPSGTLFMKFWEWWSKLVQRPFENGDPRAIKLVKGILRTLMLRRTKETKDRYGRPILVLPPTDIQVIECEQSETERDFYDALFARSKVQFDQYVAQGKVLNRYANILDLLMQLRRCCNHPFLVMCGSDSQKYADLSRLARRFFQSNTESSDICGQRDPLQLEELNKLASRFFLKSDSASHSIQSRDDPVFTPCAHRFCRECLFNCWGTSMGGKCPICRQELKKDDLITSPSECPFEVDTESNLTVSSKVSKLLDFLQRIQKSSSDEKSIVFSQWTSFFDLLENPLRSRGIGYLRFEGKLSQKQREKVLKEFNETSEKRVLLMSLRAGGVGLNLTAASNVFLMDPWWNPAVEEQAIMRIHRIGQKRRVIVRRFIVKDTVEDRLQQVQARKQRMISGALTDDEVRSARIKDLKMLFS
ncbi:Zinc finger, RING-type [Sesbania bispinosa]|nr:Zinc finger, RING-type [Sesbania bispinosa]